MDYWQKSQERINMGLFQNTLLQFGCRIRNGRKLKCQKRNYFAGLIILHLVCDLTENLTALNAHQYVIVISVAQ